MEFHQNLHKHSFIYRKTSYDKKVRARGHSVKVDSLVILNCFCICIDSVSLIC